MRNKLKVQPENSRSPYRYENVIFDAILKEHNKNRSNALWGSVLILISVLSLVFMVAFQLNSGIVLTAEMSIPVIAIILLIIDRNRKISQELFLLAANFDWLPDARKIFTDMVARDRSNIRIIDFEKVIACHESLCADLDEARNQQWMANAISSAIEKIERN